MEGIRKMTNVSLRNYFAGKALVGLIVKYGNEDAESAAKYAYQYADAMLAESKKFNSAEAATIDWWRGQEHLKYGQRGETTYYPMRDNPSQVDIVMGESETFPNSNGDLEELK